MILSLLRFMLHVGIHDRMLLAYTRGPRCCQERALNLELRPRLAECSLARERGKPSVEGVGGPTQVHSVDFLTQLRAA